MRVIRGLAALLALLAGVVGLPWLLVVLTKTLIPALTPWLDPAALVSGPDPVAILLGLLLLGAWLGWLVFLVGVVGELIMLLSGYRLTVRLPGLASVQRLAAGLLISVAAMLTTTQASSADPAAPPSAAALPAAVDDRLAQAPPQAASDTGSEAARSQNRRQPAPADENTVVHVVERGDDLWSLAQRYYGSGSDWRRIAAANPHRLTGGPDRLQVGWRLSIPGIEKDDTSDRAGKTNKSLSVDSSDDRARRTVEVREGDTLSGIAEDYYGAQRRWPVIWNANRHQLEDPDELTIGMRLVVPYRERWESADHPQRDNEKQPKRGRSTEAHATAKEEAPRAGSVSPAATPPEAPPAAPPATAAATPSTTAAAATPSADSPTAKATSIPPEPAAQQQSPGSPPQSPLADPAVVAAGLGSAGALLAASVIAGLALRRRQQLQSRPVGRRILQPAPPAQRVETALGHRARPVSLRTLDLATRAISAHCHHTHASLPALSVATVADDRLEVRIAGSRPSLPDGFRRDGDRWVLAAADVGGLRSVPGLSEAVRPYPALVTLGLDPHDRPVVGDLETLGLLRLESDDPRLIAAALAAMALELSFSPWAEEMILTLVGPLPDLPDALGRHNVTNADDVDALLERIEARAAVQREQLAFERPGQHRVDPDLADPWVPEILLIGRPLDHDHERRLQRLLTSEPRVTMAAVLPRSSDAAAGWTLRLGRPDREEPAGKLEPLGLHLTPQLLEAPVADAVLELVSTTGSEVTTAAPWWSGDQRSVAPADPHPPPASVSYLGLDRPRRSGGWTGQANGAEPTDGEELEMITGRGEGAEEAALHPTLLILGPVELRGATGPVPPRAAKQCLEYCGWLLENPGTSAQAMASALVVAEGTRRSNMSRLRSWLGSDDRGTPFLPDAYSGRISLHSTVSSDWQRLQILTAGGIDRASTAALRTALDLVRGAPLADAAPGQWHWAEELRTDMISAVRDLGVELADRALDGHDIDLARWAASRALAAAPGDELLMVARIRTEHRAGHRSEVERLTLNLAAQARQLGVDLAPETVTVLQQVMEGRVRARMA